MFDGSFFEVNKDKLAASMQRRGLQLDSAYLSSLIDDKKRTVQQIQYLRYQRNNLSAEVAKLGMQHAKSQNLCSSVRSINTEIYQLEKYLEQLLNQLEEKLLELPNIVDDSVTHKEDVELRLHSNNKIQRNLQLTDVKSHVEFGRRLEQLDFQTAGKVAKNKFVFIKGDLARLHRALGQFMLDLHVLEHGYQELYVPYLVNRKSLYGTGQLPKFADGLFISDEDLMLIPTGEVPLANSMRESIVEEAELPLKLTAYTPCFRKEAGSYGKESQGLIRQHQFDKVELFQITTPAQARSALEEITSHAEVILKRLDLPYRVIEIGYANLGFSACKSYDLEVFLPAQGTYLEVSSCSWCSDFQSRRINSKFRAYDKKLHLTHMLNGSGLAIGRTLVAIMEHYQDSGLKLHIPEVLQPYMKGQKVIE